MSEYARYPEYKDSGVPWLGEIPSHWQSKRLKFLGEIVLGLTYSPEDITTDTENSTLILRSSNVQNGKLAFDDNVFVTKNIPKKMITTENDILICSRNGSRALIGKCALIEGQALNQAFGAFMTVYRSPYRKFIYYMLNSEIFKSQLGTFLTSTINQLTTQVLGNFEISLPPDDEQKAINSFLDRELGKIDALIDKQQLLLDKLAEQRSAVITQAVTKGLNPNAEMKDSGVTWLGDIPYNWEVKKIRYLIDKIYTGSTPPTANSEYYDEGDWNWFNPADFKKSLFVSDSKKKLNSLAITENKVDLIPKNSVLIIGIGATLGKVALAEVDCSTNQQINSLIINKANSPKFITYALSVQREIMSLISNSATLAIMNQEKTKSIILTVPPLAEQNDIVKYLDQETQKIDQMTETVNRTIERLKEYRSTLITQAVTGKIKVF